MKVWAVERRTGQLLANAFDVRTDEGVGRACRGDEPK